MKAVIEVTKKRDVSHMHFEYVAQIRFRANMFIQYDYINKISEEMAVERV